MKREIKFRGKKIDNNEWVYGGYFSSSEEEGLVHYIFCSINGAEPVIAETIGQFTGIKNVLQEEIWEGDILEFPFENGIAYVINDGFRFAVKSPGSEAVDYEGKEVLEYTSTIGNIYDNPNLLQ